MKDEDIIKDDLVGTGVVELDDLPIDTEITKILKVNEVYGNRLAQNANTLIEHSTWFNVSFCVFLSRKQLLS